MTGRVLVASFLLVGKGGLCLAGRDSILPLSQVPSFHLPETQASMSDKRFALFFSNVHS